MILALTTQEMWIIGIVIGISVVIIGALLSKLYSGINSNHVEHGKKLDGITTCVSEIKVDLERKISWEEWRPVRKEMVKEWGKDIALGLAEHIEEKH